MKDDLVERAKNGVSQIRFDEGTPVRCFERDGRAIWSKVDDLMNDLTVDNSDGLIFHVRSVFVPHGASNPLTGLLSLQSHLVAAQEKLAMAERAFKDIATAQRLGPVTDTTAWARLANACQETAADALAALREPAAEEGSV